MSLRCDDLTVRLGGRAVLERLSLAFAPGMLTGVIGPNGAGKSTLLRALVGLVAPAAGSVALDGVTLDAIAPRARARRVAYLPQGQTVHWPIAVARLVALGRLPHLAPLSRIAPADAAAIERAMARADVTYLRDRVATELSGGERARVLLARALAVEAAALLVDEPLAALDPAHQLDVMALLRGEADAGATVVAVLHDLTVAARYCDRLVLLHAGAVVADGPPPAVLTPAHLQAVYGIAARIEHDRDGTLIVPLRRA